MITEKQRTMMRHALGLNRARRPYRNHYSVGPGEHGYEEWCELERNELAVRTEKSWVPGYIFSVTEAGKAALSEGEGRCLT